jgi:hypothetical protein
MKSSINSTNGAVVVASKPNEAALAKSTENSHIQQKHNVSKVFAN